MRALSDIALAISTICRDRHRRRGERLPHVERDAELGQRAHRRRAVSRGQSTSPNRVGARPAKMFSAMLTVPVSDSS